MNDYIIGASFIILVFIVFVFGYGAATRSVTTDCQKHEMFLYAGDLYICKKVIDD